MIEVPVFLPLMLCFELLLEGVLARTIWAPHLLERVFVHIFDGWMIEVPVFLPLMLCFELLLELLLLPLEVLAMLIVHIRRWPPVILWVWLIWQVAPIIRRSPP